MAKQHIRAMMARLGLLDSLFFLFHGLLKGGFSKWYLNLRYRISGAPDHLPIPPPYLLWLAIGLTDISVFLESGAVHAGIITDMLEKNGLDINDFDAILDFGCGCGRVMRHWKPLSGTKLYGTDYNPRPIKWCRQNLPFAQFAVNGLYPPLGYEAEKFDLTTARSVFTHLAEPLQLMWMQELQRVLKPGGFLLFTTHGEQLIEQLTSAELERFLSGQLVVRDEPLAGKNLCVAFHPTQYVGDRLAGDSFSVVDFSSGGPEKYKAQDVYILRAKGCR
jgi:SAM-dependent methyltransferase